MRRRRFLEDSVLAGSAPLASQVPPQPRETSAGGTGSTSYQVQQVIERKQSGNLTRARFSLPFSRTATILQFSQPAPLLKLVDEGYTAWLITMSDDSMAGSGATHGEIVLKNEQDTIEAGKRMGCKDSIFLNYPNHNMDAWPIVEMRARLVFLFRALKVDTVMVYDPSALYERNPDHYITARAVEWAAAIAGTRWDYPQHFLAGLKSHAPKERVFRTRAAAGQPHRGHLRLYRPKSLRESGKCHAGAGRNTGARLRRQLAGQGKRLPLLGSDDDSANRQYTTHFALARDRARGQAHGIEYAEYFHYIGPDESDVEAYVQQHAVPL